MYWYLRKDSPRDTLIEIQRWRTEGKWDKLSDDDKIKITTEMVGWNESRGRFLHEPNVKAREWFLNPSFIKWIFGGNRSGKTASCAMEVVMQCEGFHPLQKPNLERLAKEALDEEIRERCKKLLERRRWIRLAPIEARAVCVDFPNGVEKFVGPEVLRWATKAELKYVGHDNEKKRRIIWKNGSMIEFMTHDQELDAHGGTKRDLVWFDEEPPSEYYQENLMRVLQGGRIIGGMTAVKGITWVKDQIWDRFQKGDKDIYAIKMWTEENPTLSKKAIEVVRTQCLDEDEVEIRMHGEFKARGGLVWKEFKDRFPWIITPFEVPDSGTVVLAIDPHTRTEHAALWAWVDFNGKFHSLKEGKPNIYLIAELFYGGTIPDFVKGIEMVEGSIGRKHDLALCDPGAWIGDQRDDNTRTTVEQFSDLNINPIKGSKDLTGGIHKVRQLHQCADMDDHPRLMCFSGLEHTRWEHGKYRYPDVRGRARDNVAPKERPLDKDDHMMENMRRIVEWVWDNEFEIDNFETHQVDKWRKRSFSQLGTRRRGKLNALRCTKNRE
jgi:phage terminase large subunit-like protein